jgi:hypothetical protein
MWNRFHGMRCSELVDEFFSSLGVKVEYATDPLLQQYVNEKVFQSIIDSKVCLERIAEPAELTTDELNTLRYVAWYIPFKLKKKYTKEAHPFKVEYLSCLNNMTDEQGRSCEDSLQLYMKRWMKLIDRGGLFKINDEVFIFFHSMELEVRKYLKSLIMQT